jgi:hypothetical protein
MKTGNAKCLRERLKINLFSKRCRPTTQAEGCLPKSRHNLFLPPSRAQHEKLIPSAIARQARQARQAHQARQEGFFTSKSLS